MGGLTLGLVLLVVPLTAAQSPGSVGRATPGIPSAELAADPLTITSINASLANPYIGEVVYINITVIGGTPPYSYWWAGLPWSCHSQNASSLRCYVAEAARFNVTVTVNDSGGGSAHAAYPLVVSNGWGGPPQIGYFYAQPATAPVNSVVHILVNATSFSSTPTFELKFTFLGLPPGCASFNQTDLECIPNSPGSYHLLVQVTDGFSDLATRWTWLNVTGSTGTTPSTSGGLPAGMWIGVGAILVLVAVAAILLIPRRRRQRPTTSVTPWQS